MNDLAELRERVERLEHSVDTLAATVGRLIRAQAGETREAVALATVVPATPIAAPRAAPTPDPRARARAAVWSGERWMNRLGIALVLLGVGFLGKYSIDRGWITPSVRVLACFVIGAALFAAGVRVRPSRPGLAQVLLGGGLAVFYVTGYVAFQLYALVPHAVAFGFLVVVTALALLLASREAEPVLAIVGTVGGLATPFLLYTNAGSIAGLVGYTSAVVIGTAGVYARRRWGALLWTSIVGVALVLAAGLSRLPSNVAEAPNDRIALQLGLVLFAVAHWALPVALAVRAPGAEPAPLAKRWPIVSGDHVHLLPVVVVGGALGGTIADWSLTGARAGWLLVAGAVMLAAVAAGLTARSRTAALGAAHVLAAAAILAWGFDRLLDRHALLAALAAEGVVLHALARRLSAPGLTVGGHVVFAVVAFWTLGRFVEGPQGAGRAYTLANLSAVALAFVASWLVASRQDATIYRFAVHVGWLVWLWRALGGQPNGAALVTIAWGLTGIALMPIGLRAGSAIVVKAGFATLVLAIGKVIVFDLAHLDPIWRIGVFLGFGAAVLAVSYLVPSLWRPVADGDAEHPGATS